MKQLTKKITNYDIIFFACMLLALPFLIRKCRFGYGAADEPFYLTLAQRLAKGDALLSEEWNLAQLSGFLLLPFYKIYYAIAGSTEGIILHFRYLYVAVQTIVCILLYINLRQYKYGALCGVLLFYLYTPYDIMALSYNTMGLMGIALCFAFILRRHYVASGIMYAVSVLCNPYLIGIYILYMILYAVCLISEICFHKKILSVNFKSVCFFTLGAAAIALILFLFVLSRSGLPHIIENLKYILNDPEHATRSLPAVIYSYGHVMLHAFGTFLAAWAVVLLIALSDRNRYRNAWMYFCMTALLTAIAVFMQLPDIQTYYNRIMFPLAACGLSAYLLTKKKNHMVFFVFWITGILYTFCFSFASNQGENSICMGMPVVLLGSVLLIRDFLKELSNVSVPSRAGRYTTPLTFCIAVLLFFSQLTAQCYAKSVHAFWEPSVSALTTEINGGPLNGLLTTKEHAQAYQTLLKELASYPATEDNHKEPVLFITSSPWCYLYADRSYGTYSSWISATYSSKDPTDVLRDRLSEYYLLHPGRIPAEVYISKNDQWNFSFLSNFSDNQYFQLFETDASTSSGCIELYSVSETEHGYHLTRQR